MTSPSSTTSFPIGCGEGLEIVKLIEGPTRSICLKGIPENETGSSVGTTGESLLMQSEFYALVQESQCFSVIFMYGPCGGREVQEATFLFVEFLVFPTEAGDSGDACQRQDYPYTYLLLQMVFLRDYYKNFMRTSKIPGGQTSDTQNGEKNGLKQEELLTGQGMKQHDFGREDLSRN